ncbi:hypothetical protein GJ496_007872 [Pomphorhynchus laevis]|nr:hypothetical protein GJ496_007872 [Pomphorhynchus laevis]
MFLPVSRFGRRFFDFDNLFGNSLDLFDPFDEHDLSLYPAGLPSLLWINQPSLPVDALGRRRPRPEKYRVTINVSGFNKEDVKAVIDAGKLVVTAKSHQKCDKTGDFDSRELRKTFHLPANVIADQLTSFITPSGILVAEIPLKVEPKADAAPKHKILAPFDFDEFFASSFLPKIGEAGDGSKMIKMDVDVKSFKPNDIHVSLKDNELIVKAESSTNDSSGVSKSYYYKQVTLPPGTDVDKLKSSFNDGKLEILAPYKEPEKKMIEGQKAE